MARPEEVPCSGTRGGATEGRLGRSLTPDTARPGTPSRWRTELRSAPPGAPGSDSSSEPCGDCRSFGKSQQSPRNTPETGKKYIYFQNGGLSYSSRMVNHQSFFQAGSEAGCLRFSFLLQTQLGCPTWDC